jgi:uncharacterized protein (DUF58 family)
MTSLSATTWHGKPARVVGRRYHFHAGGLAYAATTIVLVIGAINSQNNLLFWLFGLGVAGLVISGVLSGASLMGLRIERETYGPGSVGGEVILRYHVSNTSSLFPAYAITIEEIEDDAGWAGVLSRPVAYVGYIPAGGTVTVEARARAVKRGMAVLGRVRAWTTFPFGLTRKSVVFEQHGRVLVRPWVAPVRSGLVRGVSGRGEGGKALRPSRSGDEFHSLRDFAQGDSLRAVAWRPTARLGRAVVREMATRPSKRIWIVLCTDLVDSAAEQVISVGAALVDQAHRLGFEPGLALGNGRVIEPARPLRTLDRVMDQLAMLTPADAEGGAGKLPLLAGADDGFILVCSAGSGPEGIRGDRVLVEDSTVYTNGLPAGWHPTFSDDRPARARWWERVVRALAGGDP